MVSSPPLVPLHDLVAAWDFSQEIPTTRIVDRSPPGLHGEAINLPTRAMTGWNWDGTETRIDMPETDGFVHHVYLPGVQPGQRYGFRVHGPYDPANGHRCNPNKLLLDPYAKAIDGQIDGDQSLYSYRFDDPEERARFVERAPT